MKLTKKFKSILAICLSVLFAASCVLMAIFIPKKKGEDDSNPPPKDNIISVLQSLDYSESTRKINNPDQGFYRPISVRMSETGASFNKNIINDATMLYHLRIDISLFSKAVNGEADKLLSSAALLGLEELLNLLKEKNKNAVIRFAYDPYYEGNANKEPAIEIILEHIKQFTAVLNKFESTITAVEAGLVGPWGEMHTSTTANKEHISPIIDSLLTNTNNLPILVRTPKMIYNYLEITEEEASEYVIEKNSRAFRLGLFNDGYLGSPNDLGTYGNRERDIEFLSKQTSHLPFGGEVVAPTSDLHNIDVCLPEMHKINLSYLNIEWNYQVIDKWKNSLFDENAGDDEIYFGQSAFTYIENHMGYRFVLNSSVFEYTKDYDELKIKLSLKNVGFGNLNKTKSAKIIFVNENGEVSYSKNVNDFDGSLNYECSVPLELENGKYEVYLSIFGEENENSPLYFVELANNNIFNSTLKANKVGEIEIKK